MHFALNEDQAMLRDAVADTLQDACTADVLRAAWTGTNPALWRTVAELGIFGLSLSENRGGMGLSEVEESAVAVEMGRVGFPGPFAETLAAVPFITHQSALLESVLAGDQTLAVAVEGHPIANAREAARVFQTHGSEIAVFTDPTCTDLPSVDPTRALCLVTGDVRSWPGDGQRLRQRATLFTAAMLVGLSHRMLDLAVAYAKERRQFGKAIGTFQAVQHRLADALLALRFAEAPIQRAAFSLATQADSADIDVSTAKAMASEAADTVARAALQVHGANGYTFEFDLHLFHKRVIALQRAWGDARWHRANVAGHLLLDSKENTHA